MQNIKRYALAGYARGRDLVYQYDIIVAVLCAVAVVVLGVALGLRNDGMIAYRLGSGVHYSFAKPLSILAHWDGLAYLKIARFGYKTMLDAGFFPLYPLMIRVLHAVINSYLLSALFISWTSLVGAIYFYIKIIKHLGLVGRKTNLALAVAPFVLFPTAVFMIVTYTEGLFAFFALASIYYALQKRYGLVGLFILLATLTHVTGAFLIVLDALILREEQLPLGKIAAAVVAGSSGLLLFMVDRGFLFHRPVAQNSAQELYEVAHEVLSGVECTELVPPEKLHLSLFHLGMLSCRNTPSAFLYNYSVYDANRSSFSTHKTSPWEEVDIATSGIKALRNAIVMTTEPAYWLKKERKNVINVSRIPKRNLSFTNSAYNPHVSLVKFVGNSKELEEFYECEQTLAKALESVTKITLSPLRLEYDEHSWVFRSHFSHTNQETNNNELASA